MRRKIRLAPVVLEALGELPQELLSLLGWAGLCCPRMKKTLFNILGVGAPPKVILL